MKQTTDNERDAVAAPGRNAVAIPADDVLYQAVTARRNDGPDNCRNNRGETGSLLFAAHVTMP